MIMKFMVNQAVFYRETKGEPILYCGQLRFLQDQYTYTYIYIYIYIYKLYIYIYTHIQYTYTYIYIYIHYAV